MLKGTIQELDRISNVLPDITKMRVGDILAGFEGGELSIAIIIHTPSQEILNSSDLDKIQDETRVVVVNRQLQAAVYSSWKQFSTQPEGYHLRRLVSQRNLRRQFVSIPVADTIQGLPVFVPNTVEMVPVTPSGTISVSNIARNGAVEMPWQIDAFGISDYAYNPDKPYSIGFGNVYSNNNGRSTVLYLVASESLYSDKIGESLDALGSLESALRDRKTVIVAKTAQFDSQKRAYQVEFPQQASQKLVIENGKLLVKSGLSTYSFFHVVAHNPVPGNDYQISFRSYGVEVYRSGRLAIYDKKMIWRANLYIDETDKPDWNNEHPWVTGNDWNRHQDGKTWFADITALKVVTEDYAKQNHLKAGGQVVTFAEWTPIRGNQAPRSAAVSYDYPYAFGQPWSDENQSRSSPFDFNQDLIRSNEVLKTFWRKHMIANQKLDADMSPIGLTYNVLMNWPSTRAPGNKWMNYINNPTGANLALIRDTMTDLATTYKTKELRVPGLGLYYFDMKIPLLGSYSNFQPILSETGDLTGFLLQPPTRGTPNSNNADGLAQVWGVKWNDTLSQISPKAGAPGKYTLAYSEYRGQEVDPGTNSFIWFNTPEYNRPNEGVRVYGTGTDCIGFAQQAASYKDNLYLWKNLNRDQTEDANYLDAQGTPRQYPTTARKLSAKVADWADEERLDLTPLALAVPGDLMYYGTDHIALVGWVNSVQPEDIQMKDVALIESSFFRRMGKELAEVTNVRTLADVGFSKGKAWNVARLRTGE